MALRPFRLHSDRKFDAIHSGEAHPKGLTAWDSIRQSGESHPLLNTSPEPNSPPFEKLILVFFDCELCAANRRGDFHRDLFVVWSGDRTFTTGTGNHLGRKCYGSPRLRYVLKVGRELA